MKKLPVSVVLLLMLLQLCACSAVFQPTAKRESNEPIALCPKLESTKMLEEECQLGPWINYWIQVSKLDWSERKSLIAALDPNKNNLHRFKVILLSQVTHTPYQTRLRAQHYAEDLIETQRQPFADFIQLIVYDLAQRRLELESTVTTLSRFNVTKDAKIEAQADVIEKQAQQLEQLLQIERSIVVTPPVPESMTESTPKPKEEQ